MWYVIQIDTEDETDPIGEEPYSATLIADDKEYNICDIRCVGQHIPYVS